MVFIGLAGMIDSPREEAKSAIQLCKLAGIKSVMITGDHKVTATAVAKTRYLEPWWRAITGAELDKLSDEEFERKSKISCVCPVSPSHKLR
jgi:Ca2+-transporting ATPase